VVVVGAADGMTLLAEDAATVEPTALLAVTDTTRVDPASAETTVYVLPAALAMSLQALPSAAQRRH
jgi:hypothetical protein